jgi:hypothetical protein
MTEEELILFLKENLRLETDVDRGMYGESSSVSVQLYLGKEIVSEASIWL